ncbi:MAG: pyocin knob domain-containing protein [Thermoplasmata archaeon]
MANITETATYDAAVPELATNTQAVGGPGGVMNSQAQALANRTKFIKAILDSPSGLAALVQDASESAKGVVQYAATGVPSATKAPKALGADLVALITAAGYSLSPATGTDNLDNIADGATYARILLAIAAALNAGTYDAASVTAFGIGATTLPTMATSVDNYVTAGIFREAGSLTNSPFPSNNYSTIIVMPFTSGVVIQVAFSTYVVAGNCGVKYRQKDTTWGAWKYLWSQDSDGNGGQPPAPKPALGAPAGGANGPGQFIPISQYSAYTAPGLGSAYWMGIIICHTTATGAIVAANSGAGIWAGGTVFTCAAGQTIQGFIWRQL